MMIVGSVTLGELVPAMRLAEARLGREVNPSVYPAREFRAKFRRGNSFLKRVMCRMPPCPG